MRGCSNWSTDVLSDDMRSTELTRDQLEWMERGVERHHRYYLKLWHRAQANNMALNDAVSSTERDRRRLRRVARRRRQAEVDRLRHVHGRRPELQPGHAVLAEVAGE